MTSEKLQEILNNVWMRDWSADDGHDAIWAEPFDGATQITPRHEPALSDADSVRVQRAGSLRAAAGHIEVALEQVRTLEVCYGLSGSAVLLHLRKQLNLALAEVGGVETTEKLSRTESRAPQHLNQITQNENHDQRT